MQNTLAKLFGAWCVLILYLPVAYLWLKPGIMPGHGAEVLLKLFVLLSIAGITGLSFTYAVSKRWAQRTALLETFVDSLPGRRTELPDAGPDELQSLARAMRRMAERVQQLVEKANLELSRRETIMACMAEGVLAVDKNLRVNFCNSAFAEAFSTRVPESEGRTLYEVVREPVLRDILERVAKTGKPERDLFRLPSAAGRWFDARTLPLGEEGRRGAVIALHDVTDIERQEQTRKQFVADVSHELRTPLAAIRGYAETLLDGGLEDEVNNRKFVEIIQSHAIRLNNIASDLLVISELDSNAPPAAPPERIALHEVVDSAFHTVERMAAANKIRIDLQQCQPSWVVGHRFRLEQVMVNLLDNAVKFNKAEGEVVVECASLPEGQVRVSVADNGVGIPSEDLKRIFERFYRVDKARSRPAAGGTGLGLPIVKQVVEQMGGSVSVESTLGRGAKFIILLKGSLAILQERHKFSSGAKWEDIVGYSRAIRVGDRIYVTGTTATDGAGNILGKDGYAQTVQVIRNIERALNHFGATLEHVVRTRMFVTDIKRWEEYGRAHGESFAKIKPCATMVEVRALIDPRMLIEMEVDAEL